MRFSLISIGKLDDEGYHSHLGKGKWKLTKADNGGEYRGPFEMNRTICDGIRWHLFMFLEMIGPSLIVRLNSVSSWVKKPKPFSEEQVDLGPVSPNSMGYNEHRKVVQEERVDTVDRNDEFAVDDVEENPTEQATSELPIETQLRRSTRERQPSRRYTNDEYLLLYDGVEPKSYQEILLHDEKKEWLRAMHEEMKSLHKNNTYELMELPKGKKALKNKWVLKRKPEPNRSQPRYKVRLVVKGFSEKKTLTSNRFSHREEEIYMEQPEGFIIKGKEHLVCRLKKSLYGLKQASRQWYKKFDSFMIEHGYDRTASNHCVFVKKFSDREFIILLLYVDDMLIVGRDTSFEMKDLGPTSHILGIKISRDRTNEKLWLSQESYIEKVLDKLNMGKTKPMSSSLGSHLKLSSKKSPSSEK
ncbi:hypothetical protein AAG906_004418 [Vitis piasezkii]